MALAASGLSAIAACSDGGAPAQRAEAAGSGEATDPAPRADAPESPPRLIILISIDTLRADHLGVYGYDRFTSPMIDTFAMDGAVFEDASAAAPWTLPSHASMLTGLYPMTHQVVTFDTALAPETATLPALLGEAGYRSAAAVSTGWLKRGKYNLTKDFDDYAFVATKPARRAPNRWITDQAMQWIEEAGDQKLFLMLHYFDVHGDYTSEPEYEAMFVGPYDGPADGTSLQLLTSYLEPDYIEACKLDFDEEKCAFGSDEEGMRLDAEFTRIEFDEQDIQHLVDRYDAGIRQMDAELGRFIAFLRKSDQLGEALIVVTSDHGEEFLDHGRLDHFMSTHQEVLRVPLIMSGPGVPAGVHIQSPVSLVDLVPTVLELAGASAREGLEGSSLVPLLHGESDQAFRQRTMYGEAPGGLTYETIAPGFFPVIRSIRRDHWKLIHDSKLDAYALYDLSTDPHETVDVSAENQAVAARLIAEMRERYASFAPDQLPNATVELSEEEIEELRALGYVP